MAKVLKPLQFIKSVLIMPGRWKRTYPFYSSHVNFGTVTSALSSMEPLTLL